MTRPIPLFAQYLASRGVPVAPPAPSPPPRPFVLPVAPTPPPETLGAFVMPNGVVLRNANGQVMLPPTTPWSPPPGYIPPNPQAGALVPVGGYTNVTPVGGTSATPAAPITPGPVAAPPGTPVTPAAPGATAPASTATLPTPVADQPPIVADPLTTYAVGTPLPAGTTESGWTVGGVRLVTTPDGAVRQVDANGLLAGTGVAEPTESLTILPSGVVQAPGGGGAATLDLATATPTALTNLTPEQQQQITPYLTEMQALGLSPQDYLGYLTQRAQAETYTTGQTVIDLQNQQLALQQQWAGTGTQPTPEQQQQWRTLQAQIEAIQAGDTLPGTESSANWGYAHQATDLFTTAGLTGEAPTDIRDGDRTGIVGNIVDGATNVVGAIGDIPGVSGVVGTAGFVLGVPLAAAQSGVGGLLVQAANHSGGNAENVQEIANWVNPVQSLLDVTFDPIQAATWAEQNPNLVNSAYNNGYDSDGDGSADFTGARAVWELYVGTLKWYERAGADIALDPLTYVGGVATIGRRIAGEAPEAATAATRVVRGVDDAAEAVPAPGVVSTVAETAPSTVGPVRRVIGGALQVPDTIINQGADRLVSGALGLAGRAVQATPAGRWATGVSDRVQAEIGRDQTLQSLNSATALEQRQDELTANRLTVDPPLPSTATQTTPGATDPAPGVPAAPVAPSIAATPAETFTIQQRPQTGRFEVIRDSDGMVVGSSDTMDGAEGVRLRQAGATTSPATPSPAGADLATDPVPAVPTPPPTVASDPVPAAPVAPEPRQMVNAPQNELDQAFRTVASTPWAQSSGERSRLYRAGQIRRSLSDAPSEPDLEAGRTFVDLIESTWRRATREGDTATLNEPTFLRSMDDADTIHTKIGRRGAASQNLPLAWKRGDANDAGSVITTDDPATPGPGSVTPDPSGTATTTATASASTPVVSANRLTLDDLPVGETDRRRLSEVLTGKGTVPQEDVWSRYKRHLTDATDQGMDGSEATEYAARLTGDDIMRSRGIDPKKAGKLGWWGNLSGKIATGVLYKPTTLIRRVLQDRLGDAFQLGVAKEYGAIALANDPRLYAEGVRSQQGVRGAERAFGNSEASRIIGDIGLGTRFRPELTLSDSRIDRAGGTVRQTDLSRRRQTELARDDSLTSRIWDRTKYYATGAPREVINGLGATSRIGLYANTVRDGLPGVVRAARERAATAATRGGLGDDAALIDDAFASLAAKQGETGARGFDAVQLREALRTSARTATTDPSGAVSVGLQRRIDDWANEVASGYQDDLTKLDADAMGRVDEVLFSYRPTNLDEALSKVVFFHYWSSRATKFYVTEGLKNPVLAANYFRAVDGLKRAAEEGDYPAPVRGFVRMLDTDGGFTLYMNPTALLQTYATFREAAGNDNDGRNWLERFFDGEEAGGLGTIGMVNPVLIYGMDVVGLLPTTSATDPLATNTDRRLVGNALNWARANGYLPGEQDGPLDAPYQRLLGTIRDNVSSVTAGFLPGLARHVESADPTANQTRQLHDTILTVANERFPDDPERALDEATIAMYDPDSELYQEGWERYTDAQLTQSGLQVISPFPIQTRSTEVDENSATIARRRDDNPTLDTTTLTASDPAFAGAQVERGIISEATPEAAALTLDAERSGNVGTPEGRRASATWGAIAYGDATEVTAVMPQGLTIGAQVYTPAQIATLPVETRMTLADLFTLDSGNGPALGAQRTARDAFEAGSPEYAAYSAWRTDAGNTAAAGSPSATEGDAVIAWADRTAETNGTFASWWNGERAYIERTVTDPAQQRERLAMSALSTDAYTAYNGQRPDVFAADPTPMTGPPTVATPGGNGLADAPTVDPRVQLDQEIAQYQADMVLVDTVLRSATGSPDLSYANILATGVPGTRDTADAILRQSGIEPPRMGSILYEYSTFVAALPPGADRTIDAFLRYRQQPTGPADPTDVLRSTYGQ